VKLLQNLSSSWRGRRPQENARGEVLRSRLVAKIWMLDGAIQRAVFSALSEPCHPERSRK
jgi:hypothetical protein